MKIHNSKNEEIKSGSILLWTDPDEFDIRRALAGEVLGEVDGSRLKDVRVLLHFLLDDIEEGAIVDSAVDFLLAVCTAVEPRVDGEQVAVLPARDDAKPILRANLHDVEVTRHPHLGVGLVVLDLEGIRELQLRLTSFTDSAEKVHQRFALSVLTHFVSEFYHYLISFSMFRFPRIPRGRGYLLRFSITPNLSIIIGKSQARMSQYNKNRNSLEFLQQTI